MEPCCPGCGRVLEPQEFQELLQKKKLLAKKREGFPEAAK
jgi:predicted methyltransferase